MNSLLTRALSAVVSADFLNLTFINLNGGFGDDTFCVNPQLNSPVFVDGNLHITGDRLNFDSMGNPFNSGTPGIITTPGFADVTYTNIEALTTGSCSSIAPTPTASPSTTPTPSPAPSPTPTVTASPTATPACGVPVLRHTLTSPAPFYTERFGTSVAVNGDRILVGTNNINNGSVFMFDAVTGNLIFTFPATAPDESYGISSDLSSQWALVGAPAADLPPPLWNTGRADLFDRLTGELVLSMFHPPHGSLQNANFGSGLTLEGNLAVISSARGVYVFDAAAGDFLFELENPFPASVSFGNAKSFSSDRILLGNPGDETQGFQAGAAYLFDADNGELLRTFYGPPPVFNSSFGRRVALEGDRAAIGSPGQDLGGGRFGALYLHDTETGAILQSFENPHDGGRQDFGNAVAIRGGRIVTGAPFFPTSNGTANTNWGRAYLFDQSSGALLHTFENPGPDLGEKFGRSVALRDGLAVISDPSSADSGFDFSGRVYVYEIDPICPPATPSPTPPVCLSASNGPVTETTPPNEGEIISGDYISTLASDDVYEQLRELDAGTSNSLEHVWSFAVPSGDIQTLSVEAFHDATGDAEDFNFSWSVISDAGPWSSALTVSKTADDDTAQTVVLPVGGATTIHVRVTDADPNDSGAPDNQNSLFVDRLAIVTTGWCYATPTPGPSPTPLVPSPTSTPSPTVTVSPTPTVPPRLFLQPVSQTLPLGSAVQADLMLETGDAMVQSINIAISYVEAVLEFQSGLYDPGFVGYSSPFVRQEPGVLNFGMSSLSPMSGGTFPLATLTFSTPSSGFSPLLLDYPAELPTGIFGPGGGQYISELENASVTILPGPSPTPAPTVTPAPTAPSPTPTPLAPVTFSFAPPSQIRFVGEEFNIEVRLNTNVHPVVLAQTFLHFDDAVLDYVGGTLDPLWSGFMSVDPAQSGAGLVILNGHSFGLTGGYIKIATLTFRGAAPGVSAIEHDHDPGSEAFIASGDSFLELPGIIQNGSVTILPAPSPTPSVTATRTPTPTPTPTPSPLPCCPGDADSSGGAVNAQDFLTVQANFGLDNGAGGLGDADCSGGAVNANDFLAVQANFGSNCG